MKQLTVMSHQLIETGIFEPGIDDKPCNSTLVGGCSVGSDPDVYQLIQPSGKPLMESQINEMIIRAIKIMSIA
jgi:hypothetical protein